jgi:hypothetical protein
MSTPLAPQALSTEQPKATPDTLQIEINVASLDVNALLDLDEANSPGKIARWIFAHTNVTRDQIGHFTFAELMDLSKRIGKAVGEALNPPK